MEAPSAGDERERRQLQAGDTAAAGGVGANPARPPRAHPRPATRRRNHKHQTFRSLHFGYFRDYVVCYKVES